MILNMCSAAHDGYPSSDLTAQAKIRNSAITHFARDGFQTTNMRAVAAAAGVSIGLISHHFGNKQGLRNACDEHVLEVLTHRARTTGRPAEMRDFFAAYLSQPENFQLHLQYMARAIQEDTPAANRFVNTMVEESEAIFSARMADGTMRPLSDPRTLAVFNVMVNMSTLTMPTPLVRALGHEQFSPEVLRRMAGPILELFVHGLFTDDTILPTAPESPTTTPSPQQDKD